MSKSPTETERDRALYQFHVTCPRPTADDIIEWTERYPQFAEDIRMHAAISRDWDAADSTGEQADDTVSDVMMARAHSRVLNALFRSEAKAEVSEPEATVGFHEMLAARGTTIPNAARELDIGRDVLADLFNGWMIPPVGPKLVSALGFLLGISEPEFDRACLHAMQHPKLQYAKSAAPPAIPKRSYDEVIAGSNMSPERKKFWLGET
ncbi:hypothetical protein G6K97_30605 [Agrobacterium rhizogenes]|uniref:hypothetical protein n=1 Tax=Rhizobium rhizogenes TaxID=359 RepID=UPI0005652604|nr:hypothetical protein [Rhizobium rhizogenes]NTH81497.1 hypothetical protein [Rhizobium rhizogenes]NTH87501.1 hypothetical protein [Rhizobium rhizogenes]